MNIPEMLALMSDDLNGGLSAEERQVRESLEKTNNFVHHLTDSAKVVKELQAQIAESEATPSETPLEEKRTRGLEVPLFYDNTFI